MAIQRITIDYTVYSPNYQPDAGECWDLRTLHGAKAKARGFGMGSRVHRNFNQTNKKGQPLGDWWQSDLYLIWDGATFRRAYDRSRSSERQISAVKPLWLLRYMDQREG